MFSQLPFGIATEWRAREYTTDPPRYTPYTVWSLIFRISSETPLRVGTIYKYAKSVRWGLVRETAPVHELSALFSVAPAVERVGVHFGTFGVSVLDPELKADPRNFVETIVGQAATGEVVTLATVPTHAIALQLIAFDPNDTQNRRLQKWRVRARLADDLPPDLQAMASGYQRGTVAG